MHKLDKDIKQIKNSIQDIQVDLRSHIRRTELLEKEVLPLSKFVFSFKVIIALTAFSATVYKLYSILENLSLN